MKKWTKKRKREVVEMLTEEIKNSKISILGNFSGLNVAEMEKIRDAVKQNGGNIMVLKNNLLEIIFKNLSKDESISKFISGPTFIVWSKEEKEIEIIKSLLNFQKDTGKIEIKGGLLYNEIVDKAKIEEISKLPGKKELEAKVIYLLKSPSVRLIYSLKSPILRVINVLKNLNK
ncbi:MAG: 50S ribosomal protein L10 [Candidatus Omnitrophica bacterium]|nr:50S ribosomal protein L10 [Candidatus Omnitrophota bacterium]